MKGSVDFERIEKEFRYTKECMGLMKERCKVMAEEINNSKEEQKENIREFLVKRTGSDVLLFTNGSALSNPGPMGAGAVVYVDGYNSQSSRKRRITRIGTHVFFLGRMFSARQEFRICMFF